MPDDSFDKKINLKIKIDLPINKFKIKVNI